MTQRKPNPNWPQHKGQLLEERRQRVADTDQRRNAIAQTHGLRNSGELLRLFCGASFEQQKNAIAVLRGE